jgi:heterodisulfide reductase subunit C2
MHVLETLLIRPENITTQDKLVIGGIDISGHWSAFIESRAVADYDEAIEDETAALQAALSRPQPRGDYLAAV